MKRIRIKMIITGLKVLISFVVQILNQLIAENLMTLDHSILAVCAEKTERDVLSSKGFSHFPERYGNPEVKDTYRAAFGRLFDEKEVDQKALNVLRRYNSFRSEK